MNSETDAPMLRADAQRNRDAIIASARVAFAERGLTTSLDDIAKCAGVGSGTLYRHFATRNDLVSAVFIERMRENLTALEAAKRMPDPWEAFSAFVGGICRAQAQDRGLADLMAIGHRGNQLEELRSRAYDGLLELVAAAKSARVLRADFTSEDVVLLLMAHAGIIDRAGELRLAASERFVALALDGFRAEGAHDAPPAPTPSAMLAALRTE